MLVERHHHSRKEGEVLKGGKNRYPVGEGPVKSLIRNTWFKLLLIVSGLAVTALLVVAGPPKSWSTSPLLSVDASSLSASPVTPQTRLTLSGTGLSADTRVWLVPEVTDRVARRASLHTWGGPYELVRRGHLVYVANKLSGLMIVDIADPAAPRILGVVDTPGQVMQVVLAGHYAYLADGKGGLRIVDVADPEQPKEVASLPMIALRLAIRGGYLYAAMAGNGLQVVDVSSPTQPRAVMQLPTAAPLIDVAVHEDRLVLGYTKGGVALARLDNPARPAIEQRLDLEGSIRGLASQGTELFVVTRIFDKETGGHLVRVDLAEPSRPRILSTTPLYGHPSDIEWTGDRVLVCLEANGVRIFDVADPVVPRLIDIVDLPSSPRSAVLSGEILWVADGAGLVQSVNLGRKVRHPFVVELAAPPVKFVLHADDGRLFEAGDKEIHLFEADERGGYVRRGRIALPGMAVSMVSHGGYLVVGCKVPGGGTVVVVDCRLPDRLQLINSFPVTFSPRSLAFDKQLLIVADGTAYLADDVPETPPTSAKVRLIDLTSPAAPLEIAVIEVDSLVAGAALRDGTLCLVMANGAIRLFDVKNPLRPILLGQSELPWLHGTLGYPSADVHLLDQHVVITTLLGGVKVYGIADPTRPLLLGAFDPGGVIKHSLVHDGLLLLSLSGRGVQLIDITRPQALMPIGEIPLPAAWNYLAVDQGRLLFAPTTGTGVGIRGIEMPIPVSLDVDANRQELSLTVPRVTVGGDYALWITNRNGWLELPAALRIETD